MGASSPPVLRTPWGGTCVCNRTWKGTVRWDRWLFYWEGLEKFGVNHSTSISEWGPKILFKEGPSSFAAATQPKGAQEWREWGQEPPAAVYPHVRRNVPCWPDRGVLTELCLSFLHGKIQAPTDNSLCMKESTCCGSKVHYVAVEAGDVVPSSTWNLKMLLSEKLSWQMPLLAFQWIMWEIPSTEKENCQ